MSSYDILSSLIKKVNIFYELGALYIIFMEKNYTIC